MTQRLKYRKRTAQHVTAVQLDLDTDGFYYEKWGDTQYCNRGDWIVNNAGDVYTVNSKSFDHTYETVSPGVYRKTAPIWAQVAEEGGVIETLEGTSKYQPGDYLVSNGSDSSDTYAVGKAKFEAMYERVD